MTISFAHPWYLVFLPLAAGPLILHLLSRRRMKRIEFSSLFFLRRLRERKFRWLRLRDILLLILRTLFITALVFALSGPAWQGAFPLGRVKADLVLILDDSYSTSARFDDLKKTAARLTRELSSGSRALLISASGKATLMDEPWAIEKEIEKSSPSFSGRDLKGAWRAALRVLGKSSAANRRVAFVSDGQKRALEFLKSERIPQDVEVFCFLDARKPPDNSAVINAELTPPFPVGGEEQTLLVRLLREGGDRETSVQVWADDRLAGERRLDLRQGTRELEYSMPSGAQRIRVSLTSDSMPADNERFVLSLGLRGLRVALVGAADSDLLTLGLTAGGGAEVEKVSPQVLANLSPQTHDLAIWDGAAKLLPQALAARMRGLPLLLLLDGKAEDLAGVFRFEGVSSGQGFETPSASGLFADLKDADRREIRIKKYLRLKPTGGKVIATLSGGDPLLLADTLKGVFYLTTRFTPEHTDLVYRALFPTLVQRIANYVAGQAVRREYFVGDTLHVKVLTADPLFVETPDLSYEVTPRPSGQGYVLDFAGTSQPGFYRVEGERFVVNTDPGEAYSLRLKPSELEGHGVKVYPLDASVARKLWFYLLVLAALCLVAEIILIFF